MRETFEETGLKVELTGLHNVYSYPGAPVIIVYRASVVGGTLTACAENDLLEWVRPDEIPWEMLAFPSTRDEGNRSEEHTSELQSRSDLVCRLLLEKKKRKLQTTHTHTSITTHL